MRDLVVAVVCIWFGVINIKELAKLPLGQWQPVQYLLAVVTLALLAVGINRAVRVIKAFAGGQRRAKEIAKKNRGEEEPREESKETD